jgi:hypothetical protein
LDVLVNSRTINLLAERYLGLATFEDYVPWAVACLESGFDSKNIRILASLQKPYYSSEVDDYFNRCLVDLGWRLPERKECLMEYACSFASQVVSGDISPLEGCRKIYSVVSALGYPREMMSWVYLDDTLSPDTYDELRGAAWDEVLVREAHRFLRDGAHFDVEDSSL